MRKTIVITIAILLIGGPLVVLLSYHWPRTAEFRVMETETKFIRPEKKDQYRITAVRLKDGKRMVFKNEDSWAHFKFDSADIQGNAAIAEQEAIPVKITYYGWRSSFFSWFWNVTELELLSEGSEFRRDPALLPQK